MHEIELNDLEQKLAKYMGYKRFQYCRKVGAKSTVYGNRNPSNSEVSQYGAELAFCKIMNIYPDTAYDKFNPEDCILSGHTRIDVKYTDLETGRLLAKKKDWSNPPDYFALMIGKFPKYRFAGFMKASELLTDRRLDRTLPFPAYTAQQYELIETI